MLGCRNQLKHAVRTQPTTFCGCWHYADTSRAAQPTSSSEATAALVSAGQLHQSRPKSDSGTAGATTITTTNTATTNNHRNQVGC